MPTEELKRTETKMINPSFQIDRYTCTSKESRNLYLSWASSATPYIGRDDARRKKKYFNFYSCTFCTVNFFLRMIRPTHPGRSIGTTQYYYYYVSMITNAQRERGIYRYSVEFAHVNFLHFNFPRSWWLSVWVCVFDWDLYFVYIFFSPFFYLTIFAMALKFEKKFFVELLLLTLNGCAACSIFFHFLFFCIPNSGSIRSEGVFACYERIPMIVF